MGQNTPSVRKADLKPKKQCKIHFRNKYRPSEFKGFMANFFIPTAIFSSIKEI